MPNPKTRRTLDRGSVYDAIASAIGDPTLTFSERERLADAVDRYSAATAFHVLNDPEGVRRNLQRAWLLLPDAHRP